jgi:hypothetical protein
LEIIQAFRNIADFRNHLHNAHQIEYSLISGGVTVPDRETGSYLDPKLLGTGLQEGGKKGPTCPVLVKRVSWNPAEMGTP